MPVPKRKTSKSRRDKRSSTKKFILSGTTSCPTCNAPSAPHQVCNECGCYKGVKILKTKIDRVYERSQKRQKSDEQKSAPLVSAQNETVDVKKAENDVPQGPESQEK